MNRRITLIQILIPYLAVGLGLLAATMDGGADPLPPQAAQAQALALLCVGQRPRQASADAEAKAGRCEQHIAARTR